MAKGYWVARVDIADLEAYQRYVRANAEPFRTWGARFLVRAGRFEAMEGASRSRNVVLEFPSYDAAIGCYRSPEYQAALAMRLPPVASADLIVIEGYDGPQPGDA